MNVFSWDSIRNNYNYVTSLVVFTDSDGKREAGWDFLNSLKEKIGKKLKEKSKEFAKKVLEKIVGADGTKTVDEMIREAEAEGMF